jgi:hypothetical protein
MTPRGGGLLQAIEMPLEALAQRGRSSGMRVRLREDDEVPGRQVALQAKRLAGEPLESVAVHGSACRAAGDGQTKPSDVAAARSGENGKEAITRTGRLGEDSTELRCGV